MSNTPNPRRKLSPLDKIKLKAWRVGDRVHTPRGWLSESNYRELQAAHPVVLPKFEDLPERAA